MKGAYAVKRNWIYLLAVCLGAGILIGFWQYREHEGQRQTKKNSISIGVLLYRGDDTFIGTLRTGLEDKAKEYEQKTGIKVKSFSYTHLHLLHGVLPVLRIPHNLKSVSYTHLDVYKRQP